MKVVFQMPVRDGQAVPPADTLEDVLAGLRVTPFQRFSGSAWMSSFYEVPVANSATAQAVLQALDADDTALTAYIEPDRSGHHASSGYVLAGPMSRVTEAFQAFNDARRQPAERVPARGVARYSGVIGDVTETVTIEPLFDGTERIRLALEVDGRSRDSVVAHLDLLLRAFRPLMTTGQPQRAGL